MSRQDPDWADIESAFRLMAFRTYYDHSFAEEKNHLLRFAMALVASTQPIADRRAVHEWYMAAKVERGRPRHQDAVITEIADAARRRAGRPEFFEPRGGWKEHEGCLSTAGARIRERERAMQETL